MKKITEEQIEKILQVFYSTNITAKDFDVVKTFFINLPSITETPQSTPLEVKE